ARSRFLLEARAIARLQHPNVASVYRVGQIDGRPYLVCEYVRGASLDRLAKPVSWEQLLPLAIGLARGLDAAHRGGVLHRDLKPANAILAESGEVKLLDFGLAKLLPHSTGAAAPAVPIISFTDATETPQLQGSGVLGTPLYMAPELWRGEPATPRADIYSLGALLYELATGQPPVPAGSLEQLQADIQHKDIVPTAALAPTLDPQFAALIDHCLVRDPAQRLPSAEQLAQELALFPLAEQAPLPGGNPYRGLAAFDAEHRALFYGRSTEIRAVFELLLREPLVVVSGDSGVGKSSLCRAGVLPLGEGGGLAGGRTWTTAILVPGQRPLAELAAALAGPLMTSVEEVRRLLHTPAQLADELTARQAGRAGLCLFVDQLEELVSTSDPDEAATFTQTLRALADGARGVRVLAALRGDFLARVAALPGLGELVRGLYLLRPLTASGLREVIVNPARVRGVAFESEALVTELVHETLHAEGGLPLLSFALAELWEARAVARRTIPATAL
ncbi:MAG TPA: serine/threonine-protein kinase, partial [Pseudomonadota bacterium]|nr:serine/threonine-protein kinase [Pseudomonadota bacterium]